MALAFSASTDIVNVGTGSSITNVLTGTVLAWGYTTSSTADQRTFGKGTGGNTHGFLRYDGTNTRFQTIIIRGTTNLQVLATNTNFSAWGTNKWLCLATTWSTTGAAADQKLLLGDLSAALAEPSSYSTQTAGSGTAVDNSAFAGAIGNSTLNNAAWQGRIAVVLVWNRILTLGELLDQQAHVHKTSGCVGFWMLGYNGTGTQPDWSGNANAGTVTGATVGAHVPRGPVFGYDAATPWDFNPQRLASFLTPGPAWLTPVREVVGY